MSSTESDKKWSNNLKKFRVNKGYSQADIADFVGLSQNTILQIEKGNLSGRKHMDCLSSALKIDARDIFPYYDYVSLSEAAEKLGISVTAVSKRVDSGSLPHKVFGASKMIHVDDLGDTKVKKPSIKEVLRDYLVSSGYSSIDDMVVLFAPFETEEDRAKRKRTIQSTLSRNSEFQVDKNADPPKWYIV